MNLRPLALAFAIVVVACGSSDSNNTDTTHPSTGGASAGSAGKKSGGSAGTVAAGAGGTVSVAGAAGSISAAGTGGTVSSAGAGGSVAAGAGGAVTAGAGGSVAAGAGGTVSVAGAGGAVAGGAPAGGSGGANEGGSAGAPASRCPDTLPNNGDPCTLDDGGDQVACSFGTETDVFCRGRATCQNGVWSVTPPEEDCSSAGMGTCPATVPNDGDDCMTDGSSCSFGDGTVCGCASCHGDACPAPAPPATWLCEPPPMTMGCPAIAPNAGDACTTDPTTICDYHGAGCGAVESKCESTSVGSFWTWSLLFCG